MRFQFLEIRPCVAKSTATRSFSGNPEFHSGIGGFVYTPENALADAEAYRARHGGHLFWTLYGRDQDGLATAIGNFTDKADAFEVMNALLAPMAAARDLIEAADADQAAADLTDFINQCSNEERL